MRRNFSSLLCKQLTVVAALTASLLVSQNGRALPVERFESRLQIACGEGQRSCSGSIRDTDTLGRITGFSLNKSAVGSVNLDVAAARQESAQAGGGRKSATPQEAAPPGSMRLSARGVTDLVLTLSWDGDLNPDLLSGSGLNCFDLTRQGAYALILSKASLQATCGGESRMGAGCPAFAMESKVYNASDPTGQKFSASVVTRTLPDAADIVVPFSNFIRHGPRGKASFACVGAVTVSFTFRGFSEMDLVIGPAYTNGTEGLTPLPTPTEPATLTPTSTPTSTPSSTPTMVPTMTLDPTSTPIPSSTSNSAVETVAASQSPAPTASVAPMASMSVTSGPQVTPVAEQPTPRASAPRAPEEAVYGELVSE